MGKLVTFRNKDARPDGESHLFFIRLPDRASLKCSIVYLSRPGAQFMGNAVRGDGGERPVRLTDREPGRQHGELQRSSCIGHRMEVRPGRHGEAMRVGVS